MEMKNPDTLHVERDRRKAARPMKVVVAADGSTWLCDANVDETRDLEEQGCWRCPPDPRISGRLTAMHEAIRTVCTLGATRDEGRSPMQARALSSHEVFKFLRPRQMDVVSDAAKEVTFRNGEIVFRRGEPARFLFAVLSGQVSLRIPREDGVSLTIEDLNEGELFGSCICFDLYEYSLNAVCTRDAKLIKIDAETLKRVMDDDLSVGYPLQRMISKTYFKRYLDTMKKLQTIVESLSLNAV